MRRSTLKRNPKFAWEVDLNWDAIGHMAQVVGLPHELFFEREGLKAGRFRPLYNLLVTLYFLHQVGLAAPPARGWVEYVPAWSGIYATQRASPPTKRNRVKIGKWARVRCTAPHPHNHHSINIYKYIHMYIYIYIYIYKSIYVYL